MAFYSALRYDICGICKSPFQISNEAESVLRRRDGIAFVQAGSLVGAMRSWLANKNSEQADQLFGTNQHEGSVMVSHGLFRKDTVEETRPRLKLNGHSGTVDGEKKFEVSALRPGAEFTFTILWTGKDQSARTLAEEQLERIFNAIESGEIRFGAQKNNGFGVVSLKVCKRTYDMKNQADRQAWLKEEQATEELPLCPHEDRQYTIFTLYAYGSSVLTKEAASTHTYGDSYTGNLMAGNIPVISGASVKGAIRKRVVGIAELCHVSPERVDELFGRESDSEKGDCGIAGKIRFSEVTMEQSHTVHPITRIRVNRFTAGVLNTGLFAEKPLSTELAVQISVPKEDDLGCALILFALRDLGAGLYSLGSGSAVGRGYLTPRGVVASVPGEGELVMEFEENDIVIRGEEHLAEPWLKALGGKKNEN